MKTKEESEKVGLKLNIQKMKIMASGPLTSWQTEEETVEAVIDFTFLGSKITVNGHCGHEIKRHLLLGRRKVMTNLDSVLKHRDITLSTKVHKVKKLRFFAVVKNLPINAGDTGDVGLIPGLGRYPGVENSNPLQYSCLENLMDRGAWLAIVHGVAKSWRWLSTHIIFLVVMYECFSWAIQKAEHQRTHAFILWCWIRFLRIPWTAKRSNQSILKETKPEYSLEELMLKLKPQYSGHLMWRANSLEKTDAGKD